MIKKGKNGNGFFIFNHFPFKPTQSGITNPSLDEHTQRKKATLTKKSGLSS